MLYYAVEVILTHNLPAGVLPGPVQARVDTMREVPGIYRRKAVMTSEDGVEESGAEDGWVSRPPPLLAVGRAGSGQCSGTSHRFVH